MKVALTNRKIKRKILTDIMKKTRKRTAILIKSTEAKWGGGLQKFVKYKANIRKCK
jgi:hypothetical protein